MDFGIARSLQAKGITGAGVIIGTPEYMSPELEPDSPYGHRLLGLIQLRLGKAQEAVGHLKKVLASDPNDFDALYWLTYIYAQAGKISSSRQICLRLSQIDPVGLTSWACRTNIVIHVVETSSCRCVRVHGVPGL